jgi:hypothetical protein
MSASAPVPAPAPAQPVAEYEPPAEPGLNYTCTCECCREGFTDVCEQECQIDLSTIHDFGVGPHGNKILEIILQRYKITETVPCPCNMPAEFDAFELDFEMTDEQRAEVKEEFLKAYKDETGLEECEDDDCEYPRGVEQDFTADYDHGQQMYDQQEAYYWAKGEEAAGTARKNWPYNVSREHDIEDSYGAW